MFIQQEVKWFIARRILHLQTAVAAHSAIMTVINNPEWEYIVRLCAIFSPINGVINALLCITAFYWTLQILFTQRYVELVVDIDCISKSISRKNAIDVHSMKLIW